MARTAKLVYKAGSQQPSTPSTAHSLLNAPIATCRDAMREGASDDDLRAIVSAAVDRKKAAHAGMFELAAAPNRAMVKIGG